MKKLLLTPLAASLAGATGAYAQTVPAPESLTVIVSGIENGGPISERFAYCAPDGQGKTQNAGNVNPQISWTGAPQGTRSYALLMVDRDVPASFEDANKVGKVIPKEYPRQDFYHWVLVDIPSTVTSIGEGQDSKAVTPNGKLPGKTAYGINGVNDYALKAKMGNGGGYDGSCPPWNDERLHNYYFIVYALDVPTLNLSGNFGGKQVEDAMKGHVLAQGEVLGTYTNRR